MNYHPAREGNIGGARIEGVSFAEIGRIPVCPGIERCG
jgi:hypothetical protein